MLANRILTALIIIPLVILAIVFLPLMGFIALSGLVLLYAAWEWTFLMGLKATYQRILYLIILCLMAYLPWVIPTLWILLVAIAVWIVLSIWVIKYPRGAMVWKQHPWIAGLIGILIIFSCWVSLIAIRAGVQGIYDVILLLLIVCCADTGAFFIGRIWGKTKLAPKVSPNKTKEGFYGGFLVALLFAYLFAYIFHLELFHSPMFGLLVIVAVVMSVMGDLLESMAKRIQDIKDSGQILPGHGGLLDRVDSLIAAAPFFALGAWLIR